MANAVYSVLEQMLGTDAPEKIDVETATVGVPVGRLDETTRRSTNHAGTYISVADTPRRTI